MHGNLEQQLLYMLNSLELWVPVNLIRIWPTGRLKNYLILGADLSLRSISAAQVR